MFGLPGSLVTLVALHALGPAASAAPVPVQSAAPAPVQSAAPAPSEVGGDDRTAVRKVGRVEFKPGRGFEMATVDGRYVLAVRARLQVRFDYEHPNVRGADNIHLLQIRRARLQFAGNVFGKHHRYYIQFGFSPRDMTGGLVAEEGSIRRNPVRDARLEFTYLRDLTVWVGQMKVPFSRQRVNSSGNQQFVDRSSANEEFNLDRDVGLQVRSEDLGGVDRMRYMLGVFFGQGRNSFDATHKGLLYVARFEVQPLGNFASDYEGDLERMRRPGLALGAAYAYHDDAPGDRSVHGAAPADGGTTDIHHTTVDLMLKYRGFSLLSAFHLRKARRRNPGEALDEEGAPVAVALPRDGLGWFAQAGYLLPRVNLEVVSRYSVARNTFGARSALLNRDEAGGGINYYFVGHNLKLQFDYFRVWEATPAREGTDRLRLQIQLAF